MKATWFGGGPALDAHITAAFGVQVRQALAGSLQAWEMQPLSRLALIVLLDQFTRHMFRGSSRAFEGDPVAQQLVMAALANASTCSGGMNTLPGAGASGCGADNRAGTWLIFPAQACTASSQ